MIETAPERVVDLVREGRKIEAVKIVREETGASLKDALLAVEEIEAGAAGDPMREAEALARKGRTDEAVQVLRQGAGLDLKEAQDVVDALPGPPEAQASHVVAFVVLALLVLIGAALVVFVAV